MANSFKDKYFPTISLFAICLVTTFLLALVYGMTKDTIDVRAAEDAASARRSVMAAADRFEPLDGEETLDPTAVIQAVYGAYAGDDLIGYVYDAVTTGYGGDVKSIVGVTVDDLLISGLRVTQHKETPGLGAKAANPDFYEQFAGKGGTVTSLGVVKLVTNPASEIEGISAATITSTSVTTAANAALQITAELIAKGAGQ